MAKRFGGSSPVYSYSIKLRWIVAGLSGVVIVLLATLLSVLSTVKEEKVATTKSTEAWAAPNPFVRIVTARQRIEEGMQIDGVMLQTLGVSADSVPDGAIREEQKEMLFGKYAKQLIPAGSFINADLLSEDELPALNQIPAEMRAVTITLDSRSGVDWFIKAGSRVDVLLTAANEHGEKQVSPIVPYAKVFSVDRNTKPNAGPGGSPNEIKTVTLIVSELDSRRIELGRTIGTLSLTLVGDSVNPSTKAPRLPVTVKDLIPREVVAQAEEKHPGSIQFRDPHTGLMREYVLGEDGKWKLQS